MTNETTDNTDEPSKAELHDRVRKLESTVEKLMPSRRDALKLGAAGIAGAAGLSATTQPADASTGSAGTIGSASDRPTIFADDIDANSLTGSVKNQGCRVFLSTDQSISAASTTKVNFDSEVYDSGSNFDASSHNWTCPQSGLYAVNLQVNLSGGGSGDDRQILIGSATNATPPDEGANTRQVSSDVRDRFSVSTVNKYSSGDKIAAYARNGSQGDTLSSGSGNIETFLEVAFLGGL